MKDRQELLAPRVVSPAEMGAEAQVREEPRRVELDDLTLARARRGDRLAFGALVKFYERPVFALLSRMVGADRRALVEDLAQETFVRALSAIATFGDDGRLRLSSWLYTIATRLALDAFKRRGFRTEPLDEELPDIGLAHADVAIERRTLREAINAAVERLPVGYRAVFLLREVHGLEYDAIAETLSVDLGTVKSRLFRARTILRAALTELAP
jgi:RNA polymerase sigma-70 factor (ECF subfamily)